MLESEINVLAIDGGEAIRKQPLPLWPHYAQDEIDAVSRVLASGKVNAWTGNETKQFECVFAEYIGVEHAVALANGTVALELALRTLGIGVGDAVVVTSRTFVASASAIVAVGATPIFADVDVETQNITCASITSVLEQNVKAIVVVHLAGWPCDMDPIMELANTHDLRVIEDCAQSHGATYDNRQTGSFGDIGVFSFCQDKIISTGGEGGMLVTNNLALWKNAWSYKDHGKNPDLIQKRVPDVKFRWLHESFGTNLRLSGIQAAIGLKQLEKLDQWLVLRRKYAGILKSGLGDLPGIRVARPSKSYGHAYYKFYCFVEPAHLKDDWTRDRIVAAVNAEGIPCSQGSCSEIYLEKAFKQTGCAPIERLPIARQLGETSIMLLVHPTLREDDVLDMVTAVKKVMCVAALG